VIGGAQRGAEKALLNGALGIVVPPDDVRAISDAIIQVLGEHAPRHLYDRELLRKQVLEVYGPEAYHEHVKRFMERIFSDS
jgi:glycosyltransferase involved in cell wall biosynthesis